MVGRGEAGGKQTEGRHLESRQEQQRGRNPEAQQKGTASSVQGLGVHGFGVSKSVDRSSFVKRLYHSFPHFV
eukprot:353289-Chlamydomonas_euryale.AAC.4